MSELYNNSLDGYGTPMKSKSDEIDEKQAMQDVCCVCLSPLPSLYCLFDDIPEEKELVSTKCNHNFHRKCLQEVKEHSRMEGQHCPQCPMCRSILTPIEKLKPIVVEITNSMSMETLRQTIVQAAARGRNAVRQAMLQRRFNESMAGVSSSSETSNMIYAQ